MPSDTTALRLLLVILLGGVAGSAGLLHVVSLDSAQAWPEFAGLRLPLYAAALAGLVPVVLVIAQVFRFLGVVDDGHAVSARGVEAMRRLRLIIAVFAGYLGLGFLVFGVVVGLLHPTLVLLWFFAEVGALTLVALVGVLERVLAGAIWVRQGDGLPV